MRRSHEQPRDEILILRRHAGLTFAAASLRAVSGERRAFDIAAVRDRDDHVLARDQGFVVDVALGFRERRAARDAERFLHFDHLAAHDREDAFTAAEDFQQFLDLVGDLVRGLRNIVAPEAGEPGKLQRQDGARLFIGEAHLVAIHRRARVGDQRDQRQHVAGGPIA